MWEIKRFGGGVVSLERYTPTSNESINKLESKNKDISSVSSEVSVYKEQDHLGGCEFKCKELWGLLKERIEELPDIYMDVKKQGINFKVNGSVVCYVNFRKRHLFIEILRGDEKTDGTFSKGFFNLDDPKKFFEERNFTFKSGKKGHLYACKFDSADQIDYLMLLLKQKYGSIVG